MSIRIDPLIATVLEAKSPIQKAAPPTPVLSVGPDPQSTLWTVHAAMAGTPPVSVAFAVSRHGRWQLLANDPEPPFRAFLDPAQFKNGEKVYLAAVARSLDGRTAASKTIRFTVRAR